MIYGPGSPVTARSRWSPTRPGCGLAAATPSGTRPVSCYAELGRRGVYLADEIDRLDAALAGLLTERASSLLALPGVGPDTAAILLIAAGDHPDRLAAKQRGRTCAASPPSRRRRARSPAVDSTPAATVKRMMRCGASC